MISTLFSSIIFLNKFLLQQSPRTGIIKEISGYFLVIIFVISNKFFSLESMYGNNEKKINIAIYESPGSLKYYASMDGTYPASEEISRLKGKTTAGLPYTTDELRDMAFSGDNPNQGILTLPSVVLLKGGVPIILKDGTHIGGVGVSGASGGFDKNCAEKAVEIAKNIMVE